MIPHRTAPTWPQEIPAARLAHATARDCYPNAYAAQPVALLGLPSEVGVALNAGKPGASQGPTAFRAALAAYGVTNTQSAPLPRVWDAGDVQPPAATLSLENQLALESQLALENQLHEMHARVALAASEVARTGALPIAIGGGHDLTCAFVRGVVTHARSLRPGSPLAVLNFDAHLDVRETLGSGMPFRAINAEFAPVAMGIVGANVFANTHEHAAYFQSQARGSFLADAHALTLWLASLTKDCMLACSFDLDVLDASHAPGVSARNPAGLSVAVAADMLLLAAQDSRLVCVDFMELCPARDDPAWAGAGSEAGRTARAAAHLFLTVLHARSSKSRRVVDTE